MQLKWWVKTFPIYKIGKVFMVIMNIKGYIREYNVYEYYKFYN